MDPKLETIRGENKALKNIENVLLKHGLKLHDFNIADYDKSIIQEGHDNMSYEHVDIEFIGNDRDNVIIKTLVYSLTVDQKHILDLVINATINDIGNKLH